MDGIFYVGDEWAKNITDFIAGGFPAKFRVERYVPYFLSELCVVDMFYTLRDLKDGYYFDKLILKGGHSVRCYLPPEDHRFSFDLDFNVKGKFGDVSDLKRDCDNFRKDHRCYIRSGLSPVKSRQMFHFIRFDYKHPVKVRWGYALPEDPKIEICKPCKTYLPPESHPLNSFVDTALLGLPKLEICTLGLEELLADKLYIVGYPNRQRRHMDAYDVYKLYSRRQGRIDKTWSRVRHVFRMKCNGAVTETVERSVKLCKSALENRSKIRDLEKLTFSPVDVDELRSTVETLLRRLS